MYFSPFPTALMVLAVFLTSHRKALLNAGAVLGDPHAVRRTANLLDAVSRHDLKLTRSLRQDLFALHRSLSLQNLHEA